MQRAPTLARSQYTNAADPRVAPETRQFSTLLHIVLLDEVSLRGPKMSSVPEMFHNALKVTL
ncbi:hypothetical protein shim_00540 [Shimia sp. SK013]|nr:hypothetical protein shim_00540 [Shimia sp. SK013]